jgi:hypothetical protein
VYHICEAIWEIRVQFFCELPDGLAFEHGPDVGAYGAPSVVDRAGHVVGARLQAEDAPLE